MSKVKYRVREYNPTSAQHGSQSFFAEADIKGFSRKDGGVGVDVSMFAYSLQLVGRAENGPQATETERPNNYQAQPQQTQHGANTGQITDESNLPF